MDKIDPDAFAAWGDERDERDGVQPVTEEMIFAFVADTSDQQLPDYSARPFAAWLDEAWPEFDNETDSQTNRDVIFGAIAEWCGGRTR